jgi:hypothetical protein
MRARKAQPDREKQQLLQSVYSPARLASNVKLY